jgi:ATP-binding cassette subfamily D (ALD) long-chain fatty acid import protein
MTPEQRRLLELLPKLFVSGTAGYYLLKYVTAKKVIEKEETGPIKIDKNVLKVGVDARFWKQFKYIMRICVPNYKSKTVGILVLHTMFLVMRTYLTVVVARIDGRLVKDLVL